MHVARNLAITLATFVVTAVLAGYFMHQFRVTEDPVYEQILPTFPAPEELPRAHIPNFRFRHPRLPAPTETEVRRLREHNPEFFRRHSSAAKGGDGKLGSAVLMSYLEPGSQNIDVLHRRLMKYGFGHRGNNVFTLAQAYDWLHAQWRPDQRRDLAQRVVTGCKNVIGVIRGQRLSPYNVFFYNRPFQSLMACALSVYGDVPEADPLMNFATDMLKNRVLPVWRQIMGQNGGWHEGQYVRISVGQAVYTVPALWRSATGEDLFLREPGLRGFLDFLIYRNRPDFTHFHWGDTSAFVSEPRDRIPLALEYRHKAAYSFKRPPADEPRPSASPWGPLTDTSLYDPEAIQRLPWFRFFDGLGLLVARNDWSPEATYVTFKVGDNYWSHSHLDQGAFTVFKGGALAIDSGIYGPGYGSDHHMNYSYQTIAHNTVTVTDPEDTLPAPVKQGDPRRFANDGGQRRVGSGWGIESAPLDLEEWRQKREIYHTGRMHKVIAAHDLVVAVGDVTPAYTNRLSGSGTFSHRTRRVERFWRTFAYDRVDDVIVVFDEVKATAARFTKRWLLHTQEQPIRLSEGFAVSVSPQPRVGRSGGRLHAHVLLPRRALTNVVGGPGFEFFVDGRNYDEDGRLNDPDTRQKLARREPGAWRVEVAPELRSSEDRFLVVLLPTPADRIPTHRIRLLEDGDRIGCEVAGPARTTRWWFDRRHAGTQVEIHTHGTADTHRLDARVPLANAHSPP